MDEQPKVQPADPAPDQVTYRWTDAEGRVHMEATGRRAPCPPADCEVTDSEL